MLPSIKAFEEYDKSLRSNGIHKINFYKYKNDFVPYNMYLQMKNSSGVKSRDFRIVSHIGHKMVQNEICIFNLFTTKSVTKVPTLNGHSLTLTNIWLRENIFAYTNELIFVDNSLFSTFYTIDDQVTNFPENIRCFSKRKIVVEALQATRISHHASLKKNPLFLKVFLGKLFHTNQTNSILVASNLGILNSHNSQLFLNFHNGLDSSIQIENYLNKIACEGFDGNYIDSCVNNLI